MSIGLLLWNGGSGKAGLIDQLINLVESQAIKCIEINNDFDLNKTLANAVDEGCEKVIAAGGDGTLNAIVNSLMKIEQRKRPSLGIIPLGTANDFAGTLGIPDDLHEAVRLIENQNSVPVDVVRIKSNGFERYFANIAAGGNSVRVSEQLSDDIKATWGAYSYIRGAVNVLGDMQTFRIIADCDGEILELDSWALLVANGKTNAGRILVAPKASPTDGLIDVIIVRNGDVLDMIRIVSKTLLSSFLECEQVIFRQVKQLKLHSVPGMRFTLDGEVIDEEPTLFEAVPGAIRMFVGSGFNPTIPIQSST